MTRVRSIFAALLALFVLHAVSGTTPAGSAPRETVVSSRAELLEALRARAASRILVAPGAYGSIEITGRRASGLTMAALDPAAPPRFTGVTIGDSEDVALERIEVLDEGGAFRRIAVRVRNSSRVQLRGVLVAGPGDFAAEARGLWVSDSAEIRLADSRFAGFFRAGVFERSRGLTIEHNDVADLGSDGFDFVAVADVVVARNRFAAFQVRPGVHPDYVQLWTTGSSSPSRNVEVAENVFLQEGGSPVQAIFIRCEPHLRAQNVVVRDNLILQGSPHGITFMGVDGGSIERNVALSTPRSAYTVAVRVSESAEVRVADNLASGFVLDPEVVSVGNAVAGLENRSALAALEAETLDQLRPGSAGRAGAAIQVTDAHRAAGSRIIPRP